LNEPPPVHHASRRRFAARAQPANADHWVFGLHTQLLDSQGLVAFVERVRDVEI
jgi:hypothetical protein